MTPLVKEMVSLDSEVALSFMWFDLGVLPRFTFKWSWLPDARMPFNRCAIVGVDGKKDKFLVMADQVEDNVIILSAWVIHPDRYMRSPMFAVVMEEGGCRIAKVDGEDEIPKDQATQIVGILCEFIKSTHATGYRATVKQNCLTNKRREKKGRPPLVYDWHTVTIEPPSIKSPHMGGTHASPRQHERRGHWRKCASGKEVWVKNCTVGDASRGAVFKDYKIDELKQITD